MPHPDLYGIVMFASIMFFLGRPYASFGIAADVFVVGICISLLIATAIFYKQRWEWHSPPIV